MLKNDYEKEKEQVIITVNGVPRELEVGDRPHQVAPSHTLAHTLRKTIGLTGTKVGCDQGACASCTVLMDGEPILSCMTLTVECNGRHITTIEGLQDPKTGKLDTLQQAFIDHTAFQCGFCSHSSATGVGCVADSSTYCSCTPPSPAPCRLGINLNAKWNYMRCEGIIRLERWIPDQVRNDGQRSWIPPYQVRGRLIKRGMTDKGKAFITHYQKTYRSGYRSERKRPGKQGFQRIDLYKIALIRKNVTASALTESLKECEG